MSPTSLDTQGKYEEADPLHLRAIEIGEKTLDPNHPDLATCVHNRAELLKAQVGAVRTSLPGVSRRSATSG